MHLLKRHHSLVASYILKFISLICLYTNTNANTNVFLTDQKQLKFNMLTRSSYNEVSTNIKANFEHRCNLALQNCLYQTQWEHLFNRKHTTNKAEVMTKSEFDSSVSSYHYCKAFLVAQFCINDYLPKSIDNIECVSGTNGNSPDNFKRTIYRNECKQYYRYFFASQLNSANLKFFTEDICLLNVILFFLVYSFNCLI